MDVEKIITEIENKYHFDEKDYISKFSFHCAMKELAEKVQRESICDQRKELQDILAIFDKDCEELEKITSTQDIDLQNRSLKAAKEIWNIIPDQNSISIMATIIYNSVKHDYLNKKNKCNIPAAGWYCTRKAGHDGPCAAIEAIEVEY